MPVDFVRYEVCNNCGYFSMNPMYAVLGEVCGACGALEPSDGWPTLIARVNRWFLSMLPGISPYLETPSGERLTGDQVRERLGIR